jgi:hypothetical protein
MSEFKLAVQNASDNLKKLHEMFTAKPPQEPLAKARAIMALAEQIESSLKSMRAVVKVSIKGGMPTEPDALRDFGLACNSLSQYLQAICLFNAKLMAASGPKVQLANESTLRALDRGAIVMP